MFKRAIGRIRASRKAGVHVGEVFVAVALLSVLQIATAQAQMNLPGKFVVNANGAATYAIPIDVLPGINGMQPKLSLNYNSQAGNGLLGVGWSLGGLSVITRCPQTRTQDGSGWNGRLTYGSSDRFCLDGGRLFNVPKPSTDGLVTGNPGVYGADQTYYRTERESFAKIQSFGSVGTAPDAGPSTFKVWTKSGLVMEYGNTTDSKVIAVGKTSVKVWALNKVSDVYGNYMTVSYNAPDSVDGQYYPIRIDYTGNDKVSPAVAATKSVVFEYDPDPNNNNIPKARRDVISGYRGGAPENWKVRLTAIDLIANNDVTKQLKLTYRDWKAFSPSSQYLNYPSVLSSIEYCSRGGVCTAPTRFDVRPPLDNEAMVLGGASSAFNLTTQALIAADGSSDVVIADFNGDGRSDILLWSEDFTKNAIYFSNGDGSFILANKFNIKDTALGGRSYQKGAVFADFNGDGLVDILRWSVNPSENVMYLSNGDGSFFKQAYYGLSGLSLVGGVVTSAGQADRLFSVGDFNGDGYSDIIVWDEVSSKTSVYLNDPTGMGFQLSPGVTTNQPGCKSLKSRAVADFDQDGRSDVLVTCGTTPALWSSNGDGSFTQVSIPVQASDTAKLVIRDGNDDGLVDFALCRPPTDTTPSSAWLNTGGGIIPDPVGMYFFCGDYIRQPSYTDYVMAQVRNPPGPTPQPVYHNVSYIEGDFNGDGRLDYISLDQVLAANNYTGQYYYTSAFGASFGSSFGQPFYPYVAIDSGNNYLEKIYSGDFDGDGKSDALWLSIVPARNNIRFSVNRTPTQIQSITTLNTNTPDITISYSTPAKMSGSGYTKSKKYTSGGYAFVPTTQVVSKVVLNAAQGGGHQDIAYSYGGASMDIASGRYYQGFEWVQTEDVTSGHGLVERKYFYQDFPRTGLVRRVTKGTSYLTPDDLGIMDFVYGCLDFVGQGCSVAPGKRYFPFASLITSWGNHDLTAAGGVGVGLPGSKTTVTMDNWGNVLSTSTGVLDAAGAVTDFGKTVTNVFAPADVDNWRLDKVLRSTTTNTVH